MPNVYAVIMAGGRGERFWPLSTDQIPKPFIPLLGPRTLIQQTVDRLLPIVPSERMLISIGQAHRDIAREQLPHIPIDNFIVEPVGRDTAPCLGFCALHLERRDPDGILLAVPADHHIADPAAYRSTIDRGISALPDASGVVFGIRPLRAETGYGYIQTGPSDAEEKALPVLRFVEKPDASRAREYVAAGNYFWNSGIFLWRNRILLSLIQEHMPELGAGLSRLRPCIGQPDRASDLSSIFGSLPRLSIDFGVMEKTANLRLVPAVFGWDDIGNWSALERSLSHDPRGNVSVGECYTVESENCVCYSDGAKIAVFGTSDMIVVSAQGKVLVCPKDKAAELKRLITGLKG